MARKTSTVPTKIWSFGALPPRTEEERQLVGDQLYKARRYYNRLIEIERERKTAYREARTQFAPRLAELETQNEIIQQAIEEARQEIRDLRKRNQRRTEAPGLQNRIKGLIREARAVGSELSAERREVNRVTKEARANLAEMAKLAETPAGRSSSRMKALQVALQGTAKNLIDFAEKSEQILEASYQAQRDARAACDVYWGTYLLIEEAAKVAAQKSIGDPRFKRFDGTGRIGVQIQGGMSTADLFSGKSTLLQIDPLPPDQWDTRSGRNHAHTKARIRVGTTAKGRAPVWTEFPILLHRQLPVGTVKSAWILVSRVGTRTHYELQLVLESVEFERRDRGKGTVALDVGWRSLPSGNLRVAYWVDSRGQHGSLELPARLRSGFSLPEALRGFNDTHFEAAKKVFRDWLERQKEPAEWLVEATEHIAQWRNPRRLATVAFRLAEELAPNVNDLWSQWKRDRLDAKPKLDLFAPLTEISTWLVAQGVTDESVRMAVYLHFWRLKNRHLLNWEANQRDKILGQRKNTYNAWSNWLVRTYDTIVLEEFDLRSVAKRAEPEEEDDPFQAVRHNRTIAAISELRGAIIERAAPDAVIKRSASRTTITCSSCKHVEDFDRAAELVHTCPNCERTWDQDWNAACNLLLDVLTNDPNAPPPGESPSKDKSTGAARKKGKAGKARANKDASA